MWAIALEAYSLHCIFFGLEEKEGLGAQGSYVIKEDPNLDGEPKDHKMGIGKGVWVLFDVLVGLLYSSLFNGRCG